jgi:hypothetical protein
MKNNENDQEVIVIDNPEVINGNLYVGEIVSLHVGYVFIHNIKRGYETIPTNGDVFCPVPESSEFKVGELVQFSELNSDPQRVGKFRTEKIKTVETGLDVNTPEGRSAAIAGLSRAITPYHQLKKIIADADIAKAGENKPFAEFIQQIGWVLNQAGGYNPDDINRLAEDFVRKTFSMLTPLGVKCSIMDDVDKEAEQAVIIETIELYNENGLTGQSDSLKKEYTQFKKVREAFTLMHANGLLNHSSVIEIKHMPELAFAFPVWYVSAKEALSDLTGDTDPFPDHAVEFFSEAVDSTEFAWFYQVYNRRTRPLSQFSGKDIMPPNLVKIMSQAKKLFDYVVIMTPYHDTASKEWSDPLWLRNIDPIMVGFLKGLPHMFILGRWSGTGVFPMLLDCIADTANHLKLNKHLLKNFPGSTYWYKGKRGSELGNNSDSSGLVKYAEKLLLAYDNTLLFPFLRGELKDIPEYKF